MKMEKTQIAFSQVYDIINHFEKDLYNKIPKKFIVFLQENKDDNYISDIDYTKSINEQPLLHETKVILSIVYRKYICDEQKKNKLREEDNYRYNDDQKALEEKYRIDFNKVKGKKQDVVYMQDNLPKVNKKWYHKIIENILRIFKVK